MRQRALIISPLLVLMLLLVACNSTGLPPAPAPAPTSTIAIPTATRAEPTSTTQSTQEVVPTVTALAPEPTNTSEPFTEPPTLTTEPTQPQATTTTQADITVTPAHQPSSTSQASNPTNTANPTTPANPTNVALLQQIEKDAAKVRGLQPLADVREEFINDAQLRDNLTKDMAQDYPKDKAVRDAVELWLMRLSDNPKLDLYQLEIDLQTEQVAGYYDLRKKKLFVRNEGGALSPLARQTLAHEYTHSLQDQHFDLQKLLPDHSTDGDHDLGVRSLVEGDATISGLLYASRYFTQQQYQDMITESQNAPTDVLDRAPRYIRDSLLFPYEQGVQFVVALGGQSSFNRINQALQDPPVSSEQIMHPEKYTKSPRDLPKLVALPPLTDTLGAGWTMPDNGTLGEFDLNIILDENGAADATGAAAGWGGCIYNFYENGDKSLLMINTTWDTTKDANEFETALQQTFGNSTKSGALWTNGGRFFGVKRVGGNIALGAATDRTALEKAMAAVK